jgi:hypothetical protein
MRTRAVLIALAACIGIAALAVLVRFARFDTTLEFSFRDSVSRQWVWDSTARLQDRLLFAYFQSDAGPVPFVFSHLKPGSWKLEISAPGYVPASVPVKLHRGANRLPRPIEIDYLIVVPDPRSLGPEELDRLMRGAPALPDFGATTAYLEKEGKGVRGCTPPCPTRSRTRSPWTYGLHPRSGNG